MGVTQRTLRAKSLPQARTARLVHVYEVCTCLLCLSALCTWESCLCCLVVSALLGVLLGFIAKLACDLALCRFHSRSQRSGKLADTRTALGNDS